MDTSSALPGTSSFFFSRLCDAARGPPPFPQPLPRLLHLHPPPLPPGRAFLPCSFALSPSISLPSWCATAIRNESAFYVNRPRRKEGRPRRQRTTFTTEQTAFLETEFQRSEYVSRALRQDLAKRLSLSEMQVKIWFQNRRAKDKRIEKALIDNQYRNLALVTTTSAVSIGFSSLRQQQLPCPVCCINHQENAFSSTSFTPKLHLSVQSEKPYCVLAFSESNKGVMDDVLK